MNMPVSQRYDEPDGHNSYDAYTTNYMTEDLLRSHGKIDFPLKWTLSVFILCLTSIVVIIPALAFTIPPNPDSGIVWWKSATLYYVGFDGEDAHRGEVMQNLAG